MTISNRYMKLGEISLNIDWHRAADGRTNSGSFPSIYIPYIITTHSDLAYSDFVALSTNYLYIYIYGCFYFIYLCSLVVSLVYLLIAIVSSGPTRSAV